MGALRSLQVNAVEVTTMAATGPTPPDAFTARRLRARDNAERRPDDGGIARCDRLIQIAVDQLGAGEGVGGVEWFCFERYPFKLCFHAQGSPTTKSPAHRPGEIANKIS